MSHVSLITRLKLKVHCLCLGCLKRASAPPPPPLPPPVMSLTTASACDPVVPEESCFLITTHTRGCFSWLPRLLSVLSIIQMSPCFTSLLANIAPVFISCAKRRHVNVTFSFSVYCKSFFFHFNKASLHRSNSLNYLEFIRLGHPIPIRKLRRL